VGSREEEGRCFGGERVASVGALAGTGEQEGAGGRKGGVPVSVGSRNRALGPWRGGAGREDAVVGIGIWFVEKSMVVETSTLTKRGARERHVPMHKSIVKYSMIR